jgi:hypothetical protein
VSGVIAALAREEICIGHNALGIAPVDSEAPVRCKLPPEISPTAGTGGSPWFGEIAVGPPGDVSSRLAGLNVVTGAGVSQACREEAISFPGCPLFRLGAVKELAILSAEGALLRSTDVAAA